MRTLALLLHCRRLRTLCIVPLPKTLHMDVWQDTGALVSAYHHSIERTALSATHVEHLARRSAAVRPPSSQSSHKPHLCSVKTRDPAVKSAGLRIKENKEVYEGEVTDLTPEETISQGTGQGKVIKHVIIGLRTTKGTKQLKLDPSIYDGLQKEKVAPGDVIYIEANSGSVRRVGRSDAYATEYDLEAEQYVPMPKVRVENRSSAAVLVVAAVIHAAVLLLLPCTLLLCLLCACAQRRSCHGR